MNDVVDSLPDPARTRAVLIGVSSYDHFEDLPAVRNNIEALQQFLTSAEGWELPSSHCSVLAHPRTSSDIMAVLQEASSGARDTLLVYYAGHGVLDDELRFYVTLESSKADEPWSCVSYEWLGRSLAHSPARRRIAILDSCFSGRVHCGAMSEASDAVRAQTAARGAVVLTSARDDRVALAPPGEKYTAFTGELLAVLDQGIPDGPPVISVDRAYEHVKYALAARGRPRPDRTGSDTAGRLVLARNRAFTPRPTTSTRMAFTGVLRQLALRLDIGSVAEPLKPRTPYPRVIGGRYVVDGLVGSGGMGSVYRARDQLLGRIVAIKSIRRDRSEDAELPLILRDEARAVATLNHSAIAGVHDLVESDEGNFIVMEYIYGENLMDVLRRGRVSPLESVALLRVVLDALKHAHESGVINCDIKPSNVMLTPDGRVKVLDFGVASFVENPRRGVHSSEGSIVGTPSYMSPEAIRGEAPTVHRDLYGAGVTLYELLTGRQPFHGLGSMYKVFHAITSRPVPPPSSLNPLLDPACDSILLRALAQNPSDRFQDAAGMKAALEAVSWSPHVYEDVTVVSDENRLHSDSERTQESRASGA
ncbi:protein kinase [Streptomyces sp. B1I3]|uniref:caspase, EACC1-associated type n=1 Tax=Streptomyces sp. B1I3 TaxID=3042264 RepID=UPI0027831D22|nr:protein kinase [Streptomyces sp. B1I3]MDQ0794979.1 putative Ser/Thr protein kinase [Streptomyces sp. B1I3]